MLVAWNCTFSSWILVRGISLRIHLAALWESSLHPQIYHQAFCGFVNCIKMHSNKCCFAPSLSPLFSRPERALVISDWWSLYLCILDIFFSQIKSFIRFCLNPTQVKCRFLISSILRMILGPFWATAILSFWAFRPLHLWHFGL